MGGGAAAWYAARMTRVERLLEEAMSLPDVERRELTVRLEATLPDDDDPEWLAELEQRAERALAPGWQSTSVDDVHAEALALATGSARGA